MNYTKPEFEIIKLSAEDILLASTIDANEKEGYETGKTAIDWELG